MAKRKQKTAKRVPCKYEVKGPAFEVVEGPDAGKIFEPGKKYNYDERPKGYCRRFLKIKEAGK